MRHLTSNHAHGGPVDIHQRIRLELREVWAVWRRELARFDEAGLSAAERTARLEQLQRRSLAVLAGTVRI